MKTEQSFCCLVLVRQKITADGLLSLKALLGFGSFSASGLGNQIKEYQRLFADVFECMGLAGAGDGNVAGADFGLFGKRRLNPIAIQS